MGGGVSPPATRSGVRQSLQLHLTTGRCAYCGARASPGRPLTREHLVPRSKGGGRHDHRIIVPACARCNFRRGCQDLILFLLARPCRISALLDHFTTLPSDTLRQVDLHVFAELYAALWVLEDCLGERGDASTRLRRMSGGRTVHRRRYASRRIVTGAGERLLRARQRSRVATGPSCLIPDSGNDALGLAIGLAEPLSAARARLLTLLSVTWETPAEEVDAAIRDARAGGAVEEYGADSTDSLERPRRKRRRRARIDRRRGRGGQRGGGTAPRRAA
jgi:hypothetical protein